MLSVRLRQWLSLFSAAWFCVGILSAQSQKQAFGQFPLSTQSETAKQHLIETQLYIQDGNFPAAAKASMAAYEADPDNLLVMMMYGSFLMDSVKADQVFAKIMENKAQANRGEKMMIEMMMGMEKDPQDLSALKAMLEAYPDFVGMQLFSVSALQENGDPETAAAVMERMYNTHPEVPNVHNMRGYFLMANGDLSGAKACFEKYMELAPGQANPHDSMGDCLRAEGDLKGAVNAYQQAYAIDPTMTQSKMKAEAVKQEMEK
jgi:predicted Zn-dependent protease